LSLVAILITLFYQAKELSNSTEALKEQASYLKLQAFESTFFSMITTHHENLKALDLDDTESETEDHTGRSVLRILFQRLIAAYENNENTDELVRIRESYGVFYRKNQRFVGYYLGTLNQIFKFIIERKISNKEIYWQFVKAQLTEYELLIVFYHSLVFDEFTNIELLKEQNIFENLPFELLINNESHSLLLNTGD